MDEKLDIYPDGVSGLIDDLRALREKMMTDSVDEDLTIELETIIAELEKERNIELKW